ncbi:hypothetical protein FN846DRAFT_316027 [Sphaerosporella brunnea]|uniref:Uncharacterized protein n=1 Tax=Sphaerosporella brunnea TaxID=1250544 RepID=A0A5J5EK34_9PEZI|nr:hypothetical protein FN846DRAFT_316027 [Sphaerosporella brunnea]
MPRTRSLSKLHADRFAETLTLLETSSPRFSKTREQVDITPRQTACFFSFPLTHRRPTPPPPLTPSCSSSAFPAQSPSLLILPPSEGNKERKKEKKKTFRDVIMGLPAGIRFLTNSARKKRGKERQRKLAQQQQQQQQQQRGKKWKKGKGRGSALPEHVTRDGGRGASGGSDSTATLVGDERARSQSVPREQQEQGAAAKEEETVLEAAIEVEDEKEGASAAVEQSPVKEEKSAADSKEEVQGNVLQSEVHVATETEEKENSPVKEAGEDSVPHTPQPGNLDRQKDAAADVELSEVEPSENGVALDEPVENKAPAQDEPPENVDTEPQTPSKPTRTDVSRQAQEDMGMDFPTPPRSIVSRDSKERRPSEESMRCRAFAFQVVIETPCRTTPVASTPVSAGRVTRSSARKRVGEEVSTPQEAQTPVSRKRKRSELEMCL